MSIMTVAPIYAAGFHIYVRVDGLHVNGRALDLRALRGAVSLYAEDGTCAAVTPRACEMLSRSTAQPVSASDVRAVLVATRDVDVDAIEAAAASFASMLTEDHPTLTKADIVLIEREEGLRREHRGGPRANSGGPRPGAGRKRLPRLTADEATALLRELAPDARTPAEYARALGCRPERVREAREDGCTVATAEGWCGTRRLRRDAGG